MRKLPKNLIVRALLLLFITAYALPAVAMAETSIASRPLTDASALLDAVNQLRAENELPAYSLNSTLMSAAQSHSEYQASIGRWTHTAADGSDETQRAIAAGYSSSSGAVCDEAVAITTSPQRAIELWQDAEHLAILLSNEFVDAGAGASESDGAIYYTLDVCSPGEIPSTGSVQALQTTETVEPTGQEGSSSAGGTATPDETGALVHEVKEGENLSIIADAYEISVAELMALNSLDEQSAIFPGQKLVIRLAPTPTATDDATPTLEPTRTTRPTKTSTPRPTATEQPPTATPTITPTATPDSLFSMDLPGGAGQDPLLLAIGTLVGLGVILMVVGAVLKKSEKTG